MSISITAAHRRCVFKHMLIISIAFLRPIVNVVALADVAAIAKIVDNVAGARVQS